MEGPRSPLAVRATALAYWCLAGFAAGGAVLWLLRHWLGAAHVPPPETAALIAVSVQAGLTLLLVVAWPGKAPVSQPKAPPSAPTEQGASTLAARVEPYALLLTAAVLPAGWWWLLGWPAHPRLVGAGVASALVLPATLVLLVHGSEWLERALLELAEALQQPRSSSSRGAGSPFSDSNHAAPVTVLVGSEPAGVALEPVALSASEPVDRAEAPSEGHAKGEAEDESLTQWSSRRIDGGDELIEAWSVAEYARDQRQVTLHFVFVPPFATLPELEVEPLDEAEVEAEVDATYRHGARISVRRHARQTAPCRVRIGLTARAAVSQNAEHHAAEHQATEHQAAESPVPAPHLTARLVTPPTERRAN